MDDFKKGELQLPLDIPDHFPLLDFNVGSCNEVLKFDHCHMFNFLDGGEEREDMKGEGGGLEGRGLKCLEKTPLPFLTYNSQNFLLLYFPLI